jgi:hypothetical protein
VLGTFFSNWLQTDYESRVKLERITKKIITFSLMSLICSPILPCFLQCVIQAQFLKLWSPGWSMSFALNQVDFCTHPIIKWTVNVCRYWNITWTRGILHTRIYGEKGSVSVVVMQCVKTGKIRNVAFEHGWSPSGNTIMEVDISGWCYNTTGEV